jgi:hypothetical protein
MYNYKKMKTLISLSSSFGGSACGTSHTIKEQFYNNNKKTDFFDSLLVSMKSINEVLLGREICLDDKFYITEDGCKNIKFKNFDYMISPHDINNIENNKIKNKEEVNYQIIKNEILEKYKRRYSRLIETIQNNNDIYFLRYCVNNEDIQQNEIIRFLTIVKKINPNIKPKIILFTLNDNMNAPLFLLKNYNNIFFFFLNIFIDNSIKYEEANLPVNQSIYDKFLFLLKKFKVLYYIINNLSFYNLKTKQFINKRIDNFKKKQLLEKMRRNRIVKNVVKNNFNIVVTK